MSNSRADFFRAKKGLAFASVLSVLLSFSSSFAQSWGTMGSSNRTELNDSYRLVYHSLSVATPVKVRFPRRDKSTNANTSSSPDSIMVSGGPAGAAYGVQLAHLTEDIMLAWYIWSSCIPAGVDTVWTNEVVYFFDYFGCPVDSVVCVGNPVTPPAINIFVGGGY